MMRQLAAGGGMPGMPGMPGIPGMGRGKKSKGRSGPARKAKGGRSGNPAKRAIEQKQWEARQSGSDAAGVPADFELPEELRGILPPGGAR
jgi:signal recognition particle subunit SRP54